MTVLRAKRSLELCDREPVETRPERDIWCEETTGPASAPSRSMAFGNGEPAPLEEQLAREERPIQLAQGERPLGHGRSIVKRWPSSSIAAGSRGSRFPTPARGYSTRWTTWGSSTSLLSIRGRVGKREEMVQALWTEVLPRDRVRGRLDLPRGIEDDGRDDPRRQARREAREAPPGELESGRHGAIAELGERLDRTQEVSGSNPLSSITSPKI